MTQRFEYGVSRIKDFQVRGTPDKTGEVHVHDLTVEDRTVRPSQRFWSSLHHRFGFTQNIFRYFRHDEVFQRIGKVAADDRVRWCIAWDRKDRGTLLAVSNPTSGLVRHDDLLPLLKRHDAEEISFSRGVVSSTHAPRHGGTFSIAGDDYRNKFVIETPIDGFGRPQVYLSLLRLVCSNGAVAYSRAFRSEINVGRNGAGTEFALVRVLDGFNNEEGYAALRQRFAASAKSWASVHEVNTAYRVLARWLNLGKAAEVVGGDGASAAVPRGQLLRSFHQMSGDLTQLYGLANLDSLSVKRQRTLPAACKVYDLINFASEAATHHAAADGRWMLQAYIGELLGNEFDLENTVDHFSDWKDFFIGNDATASTRATMKRR